MYVPFVFVLLTATHDDDNAVKKESLNERESRNKRARERETEKKMFEETL